MGEILFANVLLSNVIGEILAAYSLTLFPTLSILLVEIHASLTEFKWNPCELM